MNTQNSKKVIIIGGGIAGLSCATSLCDKGYEVSVYERAEKIGGKAIGFLNPQTKLPEEHSMRVCFKFFSFKNVLKRIPSIDNKTVFDHVKDVEVYYLANDKKYYKFPDARRHGYFRQNIKALSPLKKLFGLSLRDIVVILSEFLKYKVSASYRKYLTTVSFKDAIFPKISDNAKHFLEDCSQFLVAAKPSASALAIYQELFDEIGPGWSLPKNQKATFGIFDMPTTHAVIDPWKKWLESRGVKFYVNSEVKLEKISNETPKLYIETQPKTYLSADAFVFCVSLTDAKALNIRNHLPDESDLEWSNGIQFYLSKRPDAYPNEMILCMSWTSPWRIALTVQDSQLWPTVASQFKEGVQCVVSATFTNINVPGVLYGKTVKECNREELVKEMAAQCAIPEDLIVGYHLDDYLVRDPSDKEWVEKMSLFIMTPASYDKLTTDFKTQYENIFLTGEFANTHKCTPSMEKATQAGEGAAHAIDAYFKKT